MVRACSVAVSASSPFPPSVHVTDVNFVNLSIAMQETADLASASAISDCVMVVPPTTSSVLVVPLAIVMVVSLVTAFFDSFTATSLVEFSREQFPFMSAPADSCSSAANAAVLDFFVAFRFSPQSAVPLYCRSFAHLAEPINVKTLLHRSLSSFLSIVCKPLVVLRLHRNDSSLSCSMLFALLRTCFC
jgi:hypothetical protein